MFNRKLYKKEGWEQSKGLAKKMLLPSLVTSIVTIIPYIIVYVPILKNSHNLAQLSVGFQIRDFLFGLLAAFFMNLFAFVWSRFVWNFRKTGDFSFEAFKKCFSTKMARGALWHQLWSTLWFLPYTVLVTFFSKNFPQPTTVNGQIDPKAILALIMIYAGLFYMFFAYFKVLGYSMMSFILAENPEIPVIKAMNLSKKMCKGCRENIFAAYFSFSLWFIFCVVTLGFGRILFQPYFKNTFINMYEAIKKNAIETKAVSEEDFYVLQ